MGQEDLPTTAPARRPSQAPAQPPVPAVGPTPASATAMHKTGAGAATSAGDAPAAQPAEATSSLAAGLLGAQGLKPVVTAGVGGPGGPGAKAKDDDDDTLPPPPSMQGASGGTVDGADEVAGTTPSLHVHDVVQKLESSFAPEDGVGRTPSGTEGEDEALGPGMTPRKWQLESSIVEEKRMQQMSTCRACIHPSMRTCVCACVQAKCWRHCC
jgi:hypothetical protein